MRGAGAPTAPLGAAFPEDDDARERSRDEGAAWRNGVSGVNTAFGGGIGRRRTSRRARGGTRRAARRNFPAAAWDSRGRKHAWLRTWRSRALDSVEWEDLPEGPGALQPGPRTRRGRPRATTWTPRRTKATSTRAMTLTKTPLPRRATRSVPNSAPRLRTTSPPPSGRRRSHRRKCRRGHDARGDDLVAGPGSMTLDGPLAAHRRCHHRFHVERLAAARLGQDVATGEPPEAGDPSHRPRRETVQGWTSGRRWGRRGQGGDGANEKSNDMNEESWYDPAFVDSELEYRRGRAQTTGGGIFEPSR